MARLSRIWRSSSIRFASKFKFYKYSVIFVLLCGCKTWTMLADSEKQWYRISKASVWGDLSISYLEHKTNDRVLSKISCLVGPQKPLLATVKRRKLAWLGHTISHDSLPIPKPSLRASWRVGDAVVGRGLLVSGTAHNGLLQRGLEENLCGIICDVPSMTQSVKGLKRTEINELASVMCMRSVKFGPLSDRIVGDMRDDSAFFFFFCFLKILFYYFILFFW